MGIKSSSNLSRSLGLYRDGNGHVVAPGPISAPGFLTSGQYDFSPIYVSGVPQVASLDAVKLQSQRVAIPAGGNAIRLRFRGYGPIFYRLGDASVVASVTDAPISIEMAIVTPVSGSHIAVWGGDGGGVVVVEVGTVVPKTGFVPLYSAGAPKIAQLSVIAGTGDQRVALPADCTAYRLSLSGYGPGSYRQGGSTTVAAATDAPMDVFSPVIIPAIPGMTHLSMYGIGAGVLTIEGGLKA